MIEMRPLGYFLGWFHSLAPEEADTIALSCITVGPEEWFRQFDASGFPLSIENNDYKQHLTTQLVRLGRGDPLTEIGVVLFLRSVVDYDLERKNDAASSNASLRYLDESGALRLARWRLARDTWQPIRDGPLSLRSLRRAFERETKSFAGEG